MLNADRYRHLPKGCCPGPQSRHRTSRGRKFIIGASIFFFWASIWVSISAAISNYAPGPLGAWIQAHQVVLLTPLIPLIFLAILFLPEALMNPFPKPYGPAWVLEPPKPRIDQPFLLYPKLLDGTRPALSALKVTIVCIELYETKTSPLFNDHRAFDKKFAYQDTVMVELYRKKYSLASSKSTIEIELPGTMPISYEGTYLSYAWRLEIFGTSLDGTKISSIFPIWVSI